MTYWQVVYVTGRQTDRKADITGDRQTNRQTEADKQRKTDRQRQPDRQTGNWKETVFE